jgi:hypothetical protein
MRGVATLTILCIIAAQAATISHGLGLTQDHIASKQRIHAASGQEFWEPLSTNCTNCSKTSTTINRERAIETAHCRLSTFNAKKFQYQTGHCVKYQCDEGFYYDLEWDAPSTCLLFAINWFDCPVGTCG